MKYILLTILLTLSVFLFAGGILSSKETPYYKQVDNNYDNKEVITQDSSFSAQYTPYTTEEESYYDENKVFTPDNSYTSEYSQETVTGDSCTSCGEAAELLPYNGENIPMAELFPCPSIQGCINEGRSMY